MVQKRIVRRSGIRNRLRALQTIRMAARRRMGCWIKATMMTTMRRTRRARCALAPIPQQTTRCYFVMAATTVITSIAALLWCARCRKETGSAPTAWHPGRSKSPAAASPRKRLARASRPKRAEQRRLTQGRHSRRTQGASPPLRPRRRPQQRRRPRRRPRRRRPRRLRRRRGGQRRRLQLLQQQQRLPTSQTRQPPQGWASGWRRRPRQRVPNATRFARRWRIAWRTCLASITSTRAARTW